VELEVGAVALDSAAGSPVLRDWSYAPSQATTTWSLNFIHRWRSRRASDQIGWR